MLGQGAGSLGVHKAFPVTRGEVSCPEHMAHHVQVTGDQIRVIGDHRVKEESVPEAPAAHSLEIRDF